MSAKIRKYLETQKAKGKKIATLLDFRQKMSNFARKKSQNVLFYVSSEGIGKTGNAPKCFYVSSDGVGKTENAPNVFPCPRLGAQENGRKLPKTFNTENENFAKPREQSQIHLSYAEPCKVPEGNKGKHVSQQGGATMYEKNIENTAAQRKQFLNSVFSRRRRVFFLFSFWQQAPRQRERKTR